MSEKSESRPPPPPRSAKESNSDSCPVCLEPIRHDAYLDRCFHTFCYNCIAHWTRIISNKHSQSLSSIKCPLCKTENFSIIHSLSGNYFQRHYVNKDHQTRVLTKAHMFRWQCYNFKPGILYRNFNVQLYWKCKRYLKPNKWLEGWLRREIQALIEEEDVDIIVHHIHGVIESFLKRQLHEKSSGPPEQKREEFKALVSDAAKPFVLGRTEHFSDELELFLVSGLTIEAYDKVYAESMSISSSSRQLAEETSNEAPPSILFDEDIDKSY